jgi:hypothetical protein
MYGVDVSPAEKGEGDAILAKGDEGERLIANMLLAAMLCQLHSQGAAGNYIERAYALAKDLARRSVTHRPVQPSKFARLSFEVEGKIETFLISLINDALVVPAFSFEKLRTDLLSTRGPIKFVDIELVRFMLRLRMRRIVAALEAARVATSQAALIQAVEYLIAECLRHEVRLDEPLDRASDSFILAHDLVGKKNYPLAALALNNANIALDAYSNSSDAKNCSAAIQSMKNGIDQILAEIRAVSM